MTEREKPSELIRATEQAEDEVQTFSHPLNPKSEISGVSLSELTGMERIGVHLVRVHPAKEAFIYHSHTYEEEFMYILSGRGIAEIDGHEYKIEPGDFLGFKTPSVAHHLKNPFNEDLVYLMGGERREHEIADFPHLGKRIIRTEKEAQIVDIRHLRSFWKKSDEEE